MKILVQLRKINSCLKNLAGHQIHHDESLQFQEIIIKTRYVGEEPKQCSEWSEMTDCFSTEIQTRA